MEEGSSVRFWTAGGFPEDRVPSGDAQIRESYEWTVRESSDHGYVLRIDKRVMDEDGMELGRFTVEIRLPGLRTRAPDEDGARG